MFCMIAVFTFILFSAISNEWGIICLFTCP